jgi:hypothetical protein
LAAEAGRSSQQSIEVKRAVMQMLAIISKKKKTMLAMQPASAVVVRVQSADCRPSKQTPPRAALGHFFSLL